jgi:site-specific recombinase
VRQNRARYKNIYGQAHNRYGSGAASIVFGLLLLLNGDFVSFLSRTLWHRDVLRSESRPVFSGMNRRDHGSAVDWDSVIFLNMTRDEHR